MHPTGLSSFVCVAMPAAPLLAAVRSSLLLNHF